MKRKSRLIVICICFFVLFCSIAPVVHVRYTKYKEQKIFEELQTKKETVEETPKEQEQLPSKQEEVKQVEETEKHLEEEVIKEQIVLPKYEELFQDNSDLYGWIKIEDTVIDYPVMHTPNEANFYIHKNWEKEESKAGTPFVDVRTVEGETENTIIYAHNMKNRTMFGSLKDYKESSFYEEHKYIEFDTIYEEATYEIIAVSKAIIYYDKEPPKDEYLFYEHTELESEEAFCAYVDCIKENAYYETGVTAQYGDKLITLCTCDYWTANARLLVVAKKIE